MSENVSIIHVGVYMMMPDMRAPFVWSTANSCLYHLSSHFSISISMREMNHYLQINIPFEAHRTGCAYVQWIFEDMFW